MSFVTTSTTTASGFTIRGIHAASMSERRCFTITHAGRRACAAEARRLAGFVAVARQKKLLKA